VRRKLGAIVAISGVCLIVYGASVLLWRDPATDLYTRWEQHKLTAELAELRASFDRRPVAAGQPERTPLSRPSRGAALGRISIPTIGVRAVFVEGTRSSDLRRGPGHYEMTALPGSGKTVAIAGHRTTFGAPFRNIDELGRGDTITLSLPYGDFRYRVFAHRVVDKADWSIIAPRATETLVLSACHPLHSAAQRWVVFARLVSPAPLA
jgi:sortase A